MQNLSEGIHLHPRLQSNSLRNSQLKWTNHTKKQAIRNECQQKQQTVQIPEISGIDLKITLYIVFKEIKDKDEKSFKKRKWWPRLKNNQKELLRQHKMCVCTKSPKFKSQWIDCHQAQKEISREIKTFYNWNEVTVAQHYKFTKTYGIPHWKWIKFTVYKVFLNRAGFLKNPQRITFKTN